MRQAQAPYTMPTDVVRCIAKYLGPFDQLVLLCQSARRTEAELQRTKRGSPYHYAVLDAFATGAGRGVRGIWRCRERELDGSFNPLPRFSYTKKIASVSADPKRRSCKASS